MLRADTYWRAMQEMFVQYLTEQGYNVVKSNNLKNLRYADIGTPLRKKSLLCDVC